MASGATRTGEIAALLGRRADAITHSLRTLEALGLVSRSVDLLRDARATWRITDPLLHCYSALFRTRWALVERQDRARLARSIVDPWRAQVLGPHLEALARAWVRDHAADDTIGGLTVRVGPATVNDPVRRVRHELDVVAVDDTGRVLAIGEAKLRRVDADDRDRLARVRLLLVEQQRADAGTRLILISPQGCDPSVSDHADTVVVDLNRLYDGD